MTQLKWLFLNEAISPHKALYIYHRDPIMLILIGGNHYYLLTLSIQTIFKEW